GGYLRGGHGRSLGVADGGANRGIGEKARCGGLTAVISGYTDLFRRCNNISVDWPAVPQGKMGANRRSSFFATSATLQRIILWDAHGLAQRCHYSAAIHSGFGPNIFAQAASDRAVGEIR